MKCFAAIVLLALIAAALADTKALDSESIEASNVKPIEPEAARNKRGLLLGAAYTAPIAYTAPVAYTSAAYASAPYAYPYAYTAAYSSYPYYAAGYSAPYIVA